MSWLAKKSTSMGRATVSFVAAIVLIGLAVTALGRGGQTVTLLRPCQGAECDAINWCSLSISNAQGTCPAGIANGAVVCVIPCGVGLAIPCVSAQDFLVMGTDCTFTGTPIDPGVCGDCDPLDVKYAVASSAAIPTVSEWGLIVMGLLIVTVAVIVIRRAQIRRPGLMAS